MSVYDAATSGDRRELLVATRDLIARSLDGDVPARDLAALTKRLVDIAKEIEDMDSEGGGQIGEAANTPDEEWVEV